MMPCRKARSVEREARLSCERSAEGPPTGQHGGVFRAEAQGFAELLEMFRPKLAPSHQRLDITGDQPRFL
jgi:hypothetical protein